MNNFDLFDNSLFLQSWRERFRPSEIISRVVLVLLVVGLILSYALFVDFNPGDNFSISSSWQAVFVFALAVLQGYVLLFFGTMSAYSVATREVSGGTLDFHRVSPTSSAQLTLGMWLGATSVEWVIAGGIFLVELGAVMLPMPASLNILVPLRGIIEFNLALACCASLYHLFGILAGLLNHPRRRAASAFIFVVLLYFLSHLLLAVEGSFTYHLTWFPAYGHLSSSLEGIGQTESFFSHPGEQFSKLYGVGIPAPLMQFVIQVPFIIFMFRTVKRKICRAEHPLMSKVESLLLIVVIMFYYLGSVFSVLKNGTASSGPLQKEVYFGLLVYVLTLLGYAGAAVATPSYLLFMKGWKKTMKLGHKTLGGWTDYSGNTMWLMGFSCILAVTLMAYGLTFGFSFLQGILCGCFILSFPWFFGQLLEYFNLSRQRRSRIIMFVVLLILWVFIPLFGYIISIPFWPQHSPFLKYCLAASPLFGLLKAVSVFSGQLESSYIAGMLMVNAPLTVLVSLLARRERLRIREGILDPL